MKKFHELYRQQMLLRGYSGRTMESYEYAMVELARAYPESSVDQLSTAEVQAHVEALIKKDLAWSTVNVRISAFRFFSVYPKATAGNRDQALDYLGRYTHRVAISDHRILDVQEGKVTFNWRDRADNNLLKTMVLPVDQFISLCRPFHTPRVTPTIQKRDLNPIAHLVPTRSGSTTFYPSAVLAPPVLLHADPQWGTISANG